MKRKSLPHLREKLSPAQLFIKDEKALFAGIAAIFIAYFLQSTPFIGQVGHYGPIADAVFVSIIGVIFFVTKNVVRHAEHLAGHFGEPYGTLILILSASAIELIMLVTIMLHGPTREVALARDSIVSGVILSVNALLGFTLFIGGWKFGEQQFNARSTQSYLAKLATLCALGLFIPMVIGGNLIISYKIFLIASFIILYGFFLFGQTGRYSYFFTYETEDSAGRTGELHHRMSRLLLLFTLIMLVLYLLTITVLVEFLSIAIDDSMESHHLPHSIAAFIVALISRAPESLAAIRAAVSNNSQLVINIALSSALSTVALNIPVILLVGFLANIPLVLALTEMQAIILGCTIFIAFMHSSAGRTNAYGGAVLLSIFFAYLFTLFS